MKHDFSDALRADPVRFELAQRAAKLLDAITVNTFVRATAVWRLLTTWSEGAPWNKPPHSPVVLEVELRDDEGTVHIGHVNEYERDDPRELKYRMARIWGDLLEQRSLLFYSRLAEPAPEIAVTQV